MSEFGLARIILARMVRAVESARERMQLAESALDAVAIPNAVVGGHAVAAWVATVDESTLRNTQDVEVRIWRADLNDRVHPRDMIDVGLVDETGLVPKPEELSSKLNEFLDNPDG